MGDLAGLKVCFVAGTLGQGGAERQLYYILKALIGAGTEVRLLTLTRGEYWEGPIGELGVPVTWVGQSPSRLTRMWRIVAELKRWRPDVVQSQHFYTNLYAVAAARVLGLHELGAMRNDGIHEVRVTGRLLGRLSLVLPCSIAANSRAAIVIASALGAAPDRLFFLPNVVDTEQFFPANSRPSGGPVRLVAIGRLVEQKRLDRFLRVFAGLRATTRRRVAATVVGAGPLREELGRQAASLALGAEDFEFRGARSDLTPVYQESDVLVLTSDWEGTPNVVLEAMASGLPVVATKVGGVPEIVRHGETGFLAEPGDDQAMIEALAELVANPVLRRRMGNQARCAVVAEHSLQALTDRLRGLYELVLAGDRSVRTRPGR